MIWNEVQIKCNKNNIEYISNILIEYGATGTYIIDPDEIEKMIKNLSIDEYADDRLIPNNGHHVIAYYSIDENMNKKIEQIKNKIGKIDSEITINVVNDENWKNNWKKYYHEFMISKRIKIIPSWEVKNNYIEKFDVIMEPGMAFGTGIHETTKMCAKLLDDYISINDNIIDVGCGTGILSIIAKKLGAKKIFSIDIDKSAVTATKINIKNNNVKNVTVIEGELHNLNSSNKANIIVANIISDIIIDLGNKFKNYLEKGGIIICSGIISDRENDVKNALINSGFSIEKIVYDNEWVAIVANG